MKIVVENATWTNIGDAFYKTATCELLKKLFPRANVYEGDTDPVLLFRPSRPFRKHCLNVLPYEQADLFIFTGTVLSNAAFWAYEDKIRRIVESGSKYALISCHGAPLDFLDSKVGPFLAEYPPVALATRDSETYSVVAKYVPHAYDGICLSFSMRDFFPPLSLEFEKKYFISSFYRMPEPHFSWPDSRRGISSLILKHRKQFVNRRVERHFDFLRRHQCEVGEHLVIRVQQTPTIYWSHLLFPAPNSYVRLNFRSYLNLFANAEFTVSDRVHACAASITYGKPARLVGRKIPKIAQRAGIFERIGCPPDPDTGVILPPTVDVIRSEIQELGKYLVQRVYDNQFNKGAKL